MLKDVIRLLVVVKQCSEQIHIMSYQSDNVIGLIFCSGYMSLSLRERPLQLVSSRWHLSQIYPFEELMSHLKKKTQFKNLLANCRIEHESPEELFHETTVLPLSLLAPVMITIIDKHLLFIPKQKKINIFLIVIYLVSFLTFTFSTFSI